MNRKRKQRVCLSTKNVASKLRNILHSSQYCCICLETSSDGLESLGTTQFVDDLISGYLVLSSREILGKIFGRMVCKTLTSDHICKSCKELALSSYLFITKTKQCAVMYENYIKQLEVKTVEVLNCYNKNNDSITNVMFCLDDPTSLVQLETKPRCAMRHFDNVLRDKKQKKSICNSKPFKCNLCTGQYNSARNLKLHKYRMHKVRLTKSDYSCSVCLNNYNDLKELRTHMGSHSPDSKHYCVICNLKFNTRLEYKLHTRKIEHRTKAEPDVVHQQRFKNINCSICHIQFRNVVAMRKHTATHSADALHSCLHCSVQFKTRREYLNHTLTVAHQRICDPEGLKTKVRKCDQCDYSTYSKQRMNTHYVHKHLDLSPFVCEICNKRFSTKTTWQMHLKRHAKEKIGTAEKERSCDVCGKIVHSLAAIKRHMRLHTGESPYPCDVCADTFKSASDRKAHKLRKHSEKSVFCPLCNTGFYTLGNMRHHVRKAHWKSKEKFDYTKLEGLAEKDYDLFRDRRLLEPVKVVIKTERCLEGT